MYNCYILYLVASSSRKELNKMTNFVYFKLIKLVRGLQNLGMYKVSRPIAKITFALFR